MNVAVIGLGYVGLTTALCLCHLGHQVIGIEKDPAKLRKLEEGFVPFYEPNLESLLKEAQKNKRIHFSCEPSEEISNADLIIIAAGTPSLPDGTADVSQVWSAAEQLKPFVHEKTIVLIKSTVPVGTTDAIANELPHCRDVVANPEFLRQGQAVHDFFHPDRIVVGFQNEEVIPLLRQLYPLDVPFVWCDRRSAELIKYGANAFLAMKISFVNMLAEMCEHTGADIDFVAKGIGLDQRIGPHFLRAGIGYGGSCFPKDTSALLAMGKQWGAALPLIEATQEINRSQPVRFVERAENCLEGLNGKTIALFGLAFKPNTDDLREAPSLKISRLCLAKGACLRAYDPMVKHFPIAQVSLSPTPYEAVKGADAIFLLTEWEEFRTLNWQNIAQQMKTKFLADGRNFFSREEIKQLCDFGFHFLSVGKSEK